MKFRKKPVVIEATQFNFDPEKPMAYKHPDINYGWPKEDGNALHELDGKHWIRTLESNYFVVSNGDWIITGIKGEKYACKPDIFEATYEPVEEKNGE